MYILFLTGSPSIINFFRIENCTEESCCEKKECTNDTCPTNKDCGMGTCNPFMVCCNCNAVVSHTQTISVPVSFSEKTHFSFIAANCCDFMAEAWNPPKTI